MSALKPARVKHYSLAHLHSPDYAQATLAGGLHGTGKVLVRYGYNSQDPKVRAKVVAALRAKAGAQGYEIVYWPVILRKEANVK